MISVTSLAKIKTRRFNHHAMYVPTRTIRHGTWQGRKWWSNGYILEFTEILPKWKFANFHDGGESKTELITSFVTPDDECELVTFWMNDDCSLHKGVEYVILNNKRAVNIHFVNRFAKRYKNVEFLIQKHGILPPIIVKSEGEYRGFLMPLEIDEIYDASLSFCKNKTENLKLCDSCFIRFRCWTERKEDVAGQGE